MKSVYVINFLLTRAFSEERLELIEKALGEMADDSDWVRLDLPSWLVATASRAGEMNELLRPLLFEEERLFICKLDLSDSNGWLAEWVWEWLAKQRGMHDDYVKALSSFLNSQRANASSPPLAGLGGLSTPFLGRPPKGDTKPPPLGGGLFGGIGFGTPPEIDPKKPKT